MKLFDWHADTLTAITGKSENLFKNKNDIDLSRVIEQTDTYGQVFAIWHATV